MELTVPIILTEWFQRYLEKEWVSVKDRRDRDRVRKFLEKFDLDDRILKQTGWIYSLSERNCQHFAKYLLETLIERGWSDPKRKRELWSMEGWLLEFAHRNTALLNAFDKAGCM